MENTFKHKILKYIFLLQYLYLLVYNYFCLKILKANFNYIQNNFKINRIHTFPQKKKFQLKVTCKLNVAITCKCNIICICRISKKILFQDLFLAVRICYILLNAYWQHNLHISTTKHVLLRNVKTYFKRMFKFFTYPYKN